jgi:ubiquinone/menaquinone biosynthesis C-methylase UbiE
MRTKNLFEYDTYWKNANYLYSHYPTVKHRKRFLFNVFKKYHLNKDSFVFDYGCGIGDILYTIKQKFKLENNQLGGNDISKVAIDICRKKINSQYLYKKNFPKLNRKCQIIICNEVIEHTKNYKKILNWIFHNLHKDGILILTTQSGKIHASDKYAGHKQHFNILKLNSILEQIGFTINYKSLWGFPFFTIQKYLTDLIPKTIKKRYMKGKISFLKYSIFNISYLVYFIHDFIKFGPQIYIIASKK